MSIADNPQYESLSSRPGSGSDDRQDHEEGVSAPRLSRLVRAARTPVITVLGWLALLVPAYQSLVDDRGQWVFKLDSFVYYEAVRQWLDGGDLYNWYANPPQHLWPFTYTPLAAWVITPLTWMSYQSATVLLVVATPL